MKPYYVKLITGLRRMGISVETVLHDRATTQSTVDARPGMHIVDHGSQRHLRILNTGIAYIYPFWNLDPWGIRALSSIAAMRFDPDKVDQALAADFTARLRKRLVEPRISRYPQAEARLDLPKGHVAIFLQSEAHRGVEETCYLSMREMLASVVARNDQRAIVIKPHPRDQNSKTRDYLARLVARDARVQVVDANIHDILSRADVALTINSAVGMEAHLHRVPVILCGQSDFHHAAITVKHASEIDAAIVRALVTPWQHDAYLHWYFAQHCLNAGKPSLVADFLARIATEAGKG